MRREFIITLLSIIFISTLSSLLSDFGSMNVDKVLLDTVIGAVGSGNFSYWQLGHSGSLVVELKSLTGDADLYVSDTTRPSYEVDKNNFSSITCGLDVVNVPADFPRPIGIGVFGHWSHAVSDYCINVFLDTSMYQIKELVPGVGKITEKDGTDPTRNSNYRNSDTEPKPKYMKILNILDMFFEMIVL